MRAARIPRMLLQVTIAALPWRLKRHLLQRFFGYQLDPSASIGLAWVYPRHLRMAAGSRIDALTVAIHLDALEIGQMASIGRGNWITGFATGTNSPHFAHQPNRCAQLLLLRPPTPLRLLRPPAPLRLLQRHGPLQMRIWTPLGLPIAAQIQHEPTFETLKNAIPSPACF